MSSYKLTLSMEPSVVFWAKEIAKKKHMSLSKLVENYLKSISKDKKIVVADGLEIADSVKQIVVVNKPTPDFDHKKQYRKHIKNKHWS